MLDNVNPNTQLGLGPDIEFNTRFTTKLNRRVNWGFCLHSLESGFNIRTKQSQCCVFPCADNSATSTIYLQPSPIDFRKQDTEPMLHAIVDLICTLER